jgi:hypothetical protein
MAAPVRGNNFRWEKMPAFKPVKPGGHLQLDFHGGLD